MHIEDRTARRFIRVYQDFLTSLADPETSANKDQLAVLGEARARYAADRSLFAVWRARNAGRDADMLDAIERIEIGRWIYLKDTRSYSVFMHEDGLRAYAVQGLTKRLRDIFGYSGMVVQTGVFPLGGQLVCDGLFGGAVMIGPNFLADFKARYQALRKRGGFHTVLQNPKDGPTTTRSETPKA
jgi:hypothetical protein